MGQIRLFRRTPGAIVELPPSSVTVERELQRIIEAHAETLLGIEILASEYWTGKIHRGRIDSLGIDENGAPVIIEYKKALNENIIAQGLFYLNWLLDHRGDFERLVREVAGPGRAGKIDWSSPRVVCIAGEFTRYDEHAVREISRSIELITYRKYGDDLLLLELVHAAGPATSEKAGEAAAGGAKASATTQPSTIDAHVKRARPRAQDLFSSLRDHLLSLGEDVEMTATQQYVAFRRLKNFACVVVQSEKLLVTLKLDPKSVKLEEGFTRDVTNIGHWGTGNLEVTLRTEADLQRAKPLLQGSYDLS